MDNLSDAPDPAWASKSPEATDQSRTHDVKAARYGPGPAEILSGIGAGVLSGIGAGLAWTLRQTRVGLPLIKAEQLRQQGRLDEALAAVEEALAARPNSAFGLGTKGRILRSLGKPDLAQSALEQAVALQPKLWWLHAELGETLRALNHGDEALPELDRALQLNPSSAATLSTKGQLLGDLGRHDEAVEALQRAIRLDPAVSSAHAALGEVLRLRGQPQSALAELNSALELEPNSAFAIGTRGQVLRQLGQLDDARAALKRALSLSPATPWIVSELADLLQSSGELAEGLRVFDTALHLAPDSRRLWLSKVEMLVRNGQTDAALDELRKAAQVNPDQVWPLDEIGRQLFLMERNDEAVEVLDGVLSRMPDDAFACGVKGLALRALNKRPEAIAALQRAVELQPNLQWAQANLAGCLDDEQRYQETLAVIERAEHVFPGDLTLLRLKAVAQDALRQSTDALATVGQILRAEPRDGWALTKKGQLLRQSQKYDEARAALRAAVEVDPDSAWAQLELGEVLRLQNQNDEALKALNRALQLDPTSAFAMATKGQVLVAQGGDRNTAVKLLQDAVERDVTLSWAWSELTSLLYDLGQYREVVATVERAPSSSSDLLQAKGLALLGLSRFSEAVAAFDELGEAIKPDRNPVVDATAAYALCGLDEYERALQRVDAALTVDPLDDWALTVKGVVLVEIGHYAEALELLERVAPSSPNETIVLSRKAQAHSRLGPDHVAAARQAFLAVLAIDPDDLFSRVSLADIRLKLGETEPATEAFKSVYRQIQAESEVGATRLLLQGWCCYRTRDYKEAARLFAAAESVNPMLTEAAFNQGLVLLCTGRAALAERHYVRALTRTNEKDVLYQPALLASPQNDLEELKSSLEDADVEAAARSNLERIANAYKEAIVKADRVYAAYLERSTHANTVPSSAS